MNLPKSGKIKGLTIARAGEEEGMKVCVVGAGIMGLCAAWAIARRGHQVAVFEQGTIPNPLASSYDNHRLIRYPYGDREGYTLMVKDAYVAWDVLWQDLGECFYLKTGTLILANDAAKWAADSEAILARYNIPLEKLSRQEVARNYPFLNADSLDWALYTPTGGVLLAERILLAIAQHLKKRGVELYPHAIAREIDATRSRLILDGGAEINADILIVAAGPWVAQLLPEMSDRVAPSRQVVLYLEPPPEFAALWQRAPMILDIGKDAGFYAVPPVAGTGLKVGDHSFSLWGDPDCDRAVLDLEIEALRHLCQHRLKEMSRYRSYSAKTCFYTVAPEERFLVENHDKMWILSGFSGHGFKFGAALGTALAEAIDGVREPAEVTRWAAGQVT